MHHHLLEYEMESLVVLEVQHSVCLKESELGLSVLRAHMLLSSVDNLILQLYTDHAYLFIANVTICATFIYLHVIIYQTTLQIRKGIKCIRV